MVTFLDVGLFQYFNVIFSVLLIFSIMFAILHKTKVLGENVTINAIVAIAVSLMTLLSQDVIDLINFIAPWFVLVFIFVILLILMYQLFGATEKDVFGALKSEKTIQWAIFGVSMIILVAGFGHVWGEELAQQAMGGEVSEDGAFEQNVYSIVFNPKVLGIIFIFVIAIFAIAFLTGEG
ncbi:hypothetical protein GOV03_01670 [Candidatus Woesearchaeota archaeon]|nr:hypothetical protein [Candidatus Woesearchaeota archaeon]